MNNRASLVARMTVTKPDGFITIEIRANAGLHDFYTWYRGKGRGRKFVRVSGRNDGAPHHYQPNGLEVIAKRFMDLPGHKVKITILRKKQYKKFLKCSADQLPGYKPVTIRNTLSNVRPFAPRPIRLTIPVRESIETG